MIRFDHPSANIEYIPTEPPHKGILKSRPADDAKRTGPRLTLVSTRRRQISYEVQNSQIEFLAIKTSLATANAFGQVTDSSLELRGLVHIYTESCIYGHAANGAPDAHFELIECRDVHEAPDTHQAKRLLLYVAGFRDNADNVGHPGMSAYDQRHFIILRHLAARGPRCYERVGMAKLVIKTNAGSFARVRCAYTEENGWTRQTLMLV